MNMDLEQNNALSEGSLSPKQPSVGLGDGFVSGNACGANMVQTCENTKKSDFESFKSNNLQSCPGRVNPQPLMQKQVSVDGDDAAPELASPQRCGQVLVSPCESGQMVSSFGNLVSEPCDRTQHSVNQDSEIAQHDALKPEEEIGHEQKTPVRPRKRSLSTLPVSNRVLRSRSQEKSKDCESKDAVAEDDTTEANRRKRRKKKQMKKMPVDQFSSIRAHLRYLFHRIKYEQNLIDAYSGEGWKGQSLEKIKPEKELQRAKFQIFRYKLKIRDLFQRIDMLLAEGKLPEILFDADGQIDSEDIFCAKCGSKELTLENDIILCDGACERGFHQFCLEPPLLKEDIPPGDEGWLCPGCDCKVDCMAMLSDFQGSNFSVLDKWENVFPEEAAAAASGMKMDDYSGVPSDDSEDDDYDPEKREQDQVLGEESDSHGSDYFSACDDNVNVVDKQILGLPSDDSEDDDFDPSAPDHSEQSKQESSSSDFTSDSEGENLDAILDGDESSGNEQRCNLVSDQPMGSDEKVKVGKAKRHSLSDELEFLSKSGDAPKSAKRQVERLDYQKLHQETYGDTSTDSSDEDYGGTADVKRREIGSRKDNAPQKINDVDTKDENHSQKVSGKTPTEKSNKNQWVGSSTEFTETESIPGDGGSCGKSANRTYKRLEEGAVQRLLESFRQNQYPKHDVKESLAKELGLRIQQVSKWFENARWSYRHSTHMEAKMCGNGLANGTSSPQMRGKAAEQGPKSVADNACCNGPETTPSQVTPGMEEGCSGGATEAKSSSGSSLKSRKRRGGKFDDENVDELSGAEKAPVQDSYGDASNSVTTRRSSRLQSRNSS